MSGREVISSPSRSDDSSSSLKDMDTWRAIGRTERRPARLMWLLKKYEKRGHTQWCCCQGNRLVRWTYSGEKGGTSTITHNSFRTIFVRPRQLYWELQANLNSTARFGLQSWSHALSRKEGRDTANRAPAHIAYSPTTSLFLHAKRFDNTALCISTVVYQIAKAST